MSTPKRRLPGSAPPGPGQTRTTTQAGVSPRMPHERDESSDSQIGATSGIVKQAYDDVQRGLTDTDRGPPMDEVYHRSVRSKKSKSKPAREARRK